MLELDEATRRALSQRYGPTPESQARVLAELRSTLAGPIGPDGGAAGEGGPPVGAPPSDGGQLVWIAKICAATAGLTGAGLLALKLGATVLGVGEAKEPSAAPVKVDVAEPAPVATTTATTPETTIDVDADVPSPRRAAVPIQTPTKPVEASSTLAAELALLDAARRLRDSDPNAALRRLDQHQKEFPTGVLAPERDALRVDVLHALDVKDSDKTGD